MKIIKFQKKKANLYVVTFSNNDKISLYDDVILKYELLIKKEFPDKLLKEILEYNSFIESYNVSLKYINTKLRTEKEIRKKLDKYSKEAIDYSITRLKKEGYINNKLYIQAYINDEINLKLSGPNKIKINLKKLGFKDEEINDYLASVDKEIWLNKINKYISKKVVSNHNLSGFNLKQKLYQDLINKGFYKEDIATIINEVKFNDNSAIYEKEYIKQKNKLSKKYSGEELEYRIKIALYKKGFKKDLD